MHRNDTVIMQCRWKEVLDLPPFKAKDQKDALLVEHSLYWVRGLMEGGDLSELSVVRLKALLQDVYRRGRLSVLEGDVSDPE